MYSIILKNADIGIFDWPLDSNRLYLSPSLTSMLGFQNAEFAETFEDFMGHVQPGERSRFELDIETAIDNGTEKFQGLYPMTHHGGYRIWFLFRLRLLRSGDGRPIRFAGVVMDVTETKNDLVVSPTM